MANKIKVIVKYPGEPVGHISTMDNALKAFQGAVRGYIETVELKDGVILICNEEGKIRELRPNFVIRTPYWADVIYGTAVIAGSDGEEFADVPIGLDEWSEMLKEWE